MGLIQVCPDAEGEEVVPPTLSQLETVGDARRKNFLAKAMARQEQQQTMSRSRPSSAIPSSTIPASHSITPTLRCISACPTTSTSTHSASPHSTHKKAALSAISSRSTTTSPAMGPRAHPHPHRPPSAARHAASASMAPWSFSSPWVTQAPRDVAAGTTRAQEPNLSDTLANTHTTDMSVLRRQPTSAFSSSYRGPGIPPRSQSRTPSTRSTRTHTDVVAAAAPAATLPRRPASATIPHRTRQPAQFLYPDLSVAPATCCGIARGENTEGAHSGQATGKRSVHICSPRSGPTPTPTAPAAAPLSSSLSAAPGASARFPTGPPSTAPHTPSDTSRSLSPARSAPSSPTRASRASSTGLTTTITHPPPLSPTTTHGTPTTQFTPTGRGACSHSPSRVPSQSLGSRDTTVVPGTSTPFFNVSTGAGLGHAHAHSRAPSQGVGGRDATEQGYKNRSGGARSGGAEGGGGVSRSSSWLLNTQLSLARKQHDAAAAAGEQREKARALPQWSVNARPLEDMLQFQGRDRDGFDPLASQHASQQHSRSCSPTQDAVHDNRPRIISEDELPVGALATAIFMAQTSGSMEGLRGLGIAKLPKQAFQYLQNEGRLLQGTLDLSHNFFSSLSFLHLVPSIMCLNLAHNQLVLLPAQVFSPLKETLTSLDLSHNKLEELPSSLGMLRSLKHLDASHNALEVLPSAVSELTALESLKLDHNRLSSLPLGTSCLTSLQQLSAVANRMTGLPPELGSCTALSYIDLRQNSLTALPTSLKGLHTWLQDLHLDDNALTVLPREVALLTRLTRLTLSCNPLLFPPGPVAAGGPEAVRTYLGMHSTPRSSMQANLREGEHGRNQQGRDGTSPERKRPGYQSHERIPEDVVASTQVLCQDYNPENQGALLLHMQFEAEEHERRERLMQKRVDASEERAAKAERDAAELAETLRSTLENTQAARTPRMGTFYEQGSAELACAVRHLESDLRQVRGELHMARKQLAEARSSEAELRRLADTAAKDASEGVQSVQRARDLEAENRQLRAKEAELTRKLAHQLNEYKQLEDRCWKAESHLESTVYGEHGATKRELQCLREQMLVAKLEAGAAAEAARTREDALKSQISEREASLEATRKTMRDMSESIDTVARVQQIGWQAVSPQNEPLYAKSSEEEAAKRRRALISQIFPAAG